MKKILPLFNVLFYAFFCLISNAQETPNRADSLRILSIDRHLQNNLISNNFIYSPDGLLYLRFNNGFYALSNGSGDSWSQICKDIDQISIDPKNPQILYAISKTRQVFKSMDRAKNWIKIENGLPQGIYPIRLLINPHNSSEVFLLTTTGLFKTSDGGFSWNPLKTDSPPLEFIVHSTKKETYYLLTQLGLNISNDAGLSWKKISSNLPMILEKGIGRTSAKRTIRINSFINVNYPNSSFILAITEKGIFKTNDDGNSWIEINDGLSTSDLFISIFLSEKEIFIGGTYYNESTKNQEPKLYKTDIYANKWSKIDIKSDEIDGIVGIYKDYSNPGTFIYSFNSKIAYIDEKLNVIGLNYGVTPHSKVQAFNIIKNGNNNTQFAIVDNNNYTDVLNHSIWRSRNNGVSWENCLKNIPNPKYVESSVSRIVQSPTNPFEIFIFDEKYKYVSNDGGLNWLDFNSIFSLRDVKDFEYDPINEKILYFTLGVNHYDVELYRIDKTTWGYTKLCQSGFSVFIAKDDNNKILTSNGNLSIDGGWTWNIVTKDSPELEHYQLLPFCIEGKQIDLIAEKTIFHSDDLGKTWNWKSEPLDGLSFHYVNKNDPSNIIIVKKTKSDENGSNDGLCVLQSYDMGKNWKSIFTLTPKNISDYSSVTDLSETFLDEFILSIYSEQVDDHREVYLGLKSGGMILSKDSGNTWQKLGGINGNK